MESITESMRKILEYENFLNEFSGKRYHIVQRNDELFDVIEVEKIGEDKIIVMGLNLIQLYTYLKKNMKVTLQSDDSLKAVAHVEELWDKLDPRDRDVIIRHSGMKINTLCDWRALSRKEQNGLVRWLYHI